MVEDRFALVTGSSRGIGKAINQRLAVAGYRTIVHYRRDEEGAREAAAALAAAGTPALIIKGDMGDADQVAALFDEIDGRFGRLDVFVANAASTALKPLLESHVRHTERTYRENVVNLVESFRRAAALMSCGGRIVYVSGLQARAVYPGYSLLGPAKAAGEEMIKHLAFELGPRGITANAVVPGFIETVSAERTFGPEYVNMAARFVTRIPVRRAGTPEDIAGLVAYLVSAQAGFLSGQSIVVDGGMSAVSSSWLAATL